jgi:pimeloyl-ACP methyl ester carboxylesterase
MSIFVFVPGGWHGGWCWKRVADLLRAQGHEVYTPTLTGLGERAHLFGPTVDLETHIADILGLLEWEDLREVILVGHSYGGMVITGVADRVPERLSRVVYLDALWPGDGEAVGDVIGEAAVQGVIAAGVDPARPPLIAGGSMIAQTLGVTDPDDIAWLASKLTPQPPGALRQPLRLKAPLGVGIVYVMCVDSPTTEEGLRLSWNRAGKRAAEDPSVRIVSLNAPHNAMVTHPVEVAEVLLGATD